MPSVIAIRFEVPEFSRLASQSVSEWILANVHTSVRREKNFAVLLK